MRQSVSERPGQWLAGRIRTFLMYQPFHIQSSFCLADIEMLLTSSLRGHSRCHGCRGALAEATKCI